MTLNYIKIEKEYVELYSPYSGNCFNNGEEVLYEPENDPTCLFTYIGGAGEWGYISPRVEAILKNLDLNIEDIEPKIISKMLTIDGGVVFECNDGWNGTIWFAFAPALEE
ncbi:hypothetical protein C9J21_18850 [Photobacterium phosphoreum]|uniref:hypothetical protein n=1 Tax=Photobacterium phosphoreum TaxID=659 RepID=UPI0005D3D038|nr:hypothetical protein [Photobacterium phosphoreum]KJF84488.1 hypothetical protein UB41_19975 [Photobacterium phosphoreum]PQJ84045.1 hypothetical protein BTO21_18905 [Photobacterium phosphoreum]PSV70791.1 hypothetical protein CTM77_10285 [Photobacterium phosphoreum]PSW30455.1 hypothetical protein C9J21_18850 [Photobacterium phosphoreum]